MSSSSLGELKFPLEERLLARVCISSNRFEDWRVLAQREIDDVLRDLKSWYYRPNDRKQTHRPVYERDAIRGFIRPMENSRKHDLFSLAHLQLSLEDVVYGLHVTTIADQRAVFAHMYGDTFLDGAVLRALEGASVQDPFHFVGLKWVAFNSPAPAVLSGRDYVYFEYSGTTEDAAGRKVLFLFQRSFPLQANELAEPDKGCTRGDFNQLLLFRMESGAVLLQGISQFDPAADVPAWVSTRGITEAFDSIKNLVGLADVRSISASGLIKQAPIPGVAGASSDSVKSASENKNCVGCNKKFGLLRARHACRACGQGMCKHCVTTLSFFNDEAFFSAVPTVLIEIFCEICLKHARERRRMDTLSATLTKTNLSSTTTTTHLRGTDAMSSHHSSSSSATYEPAGGASRPQQSHHSHHNHHNQHKHHREDLRHSIERQIGIPHFTDSSGSNRSVTAQTLYVPGDNGTPVGRSPVSQASYTTTGPNQRSTGAPPAAPVMFEQMNASIREQEELLMVIKQERAKIQSRQGAPAITPPPQFTPLSHQTHTSFNCTNGMARPPAAAPPAHGFYEAVHDDESEERFQVLA